MAPSEAQPCMSHEQLLSNRDGKLSLHRLEDFFFFFYLSSCLRASEMLIAYL